MKRKQAAALIDYVRTTVSRKQSGELTAEQALAFIQREFHDMGLYDLSPCPGNAHRVGEGEANGMQDHCLLCAPRWGWCGTVEAVR